MQGLHEHDGVPRGRDGFVVRDELVELVDDDDHDDFDDFFQRVVIVVFVFFIELIEQLELVDRRGGGRRSGRRADGRRRRLSGRYFTEIPYFLRKARTWWRSIPLCRAISLTLPLVARASSLK